MEHLEGRQSVLAALRARQRKFQVILVAHGAHVEKLAELLDVAGELGVPVKTVDRKELDAVAHGATHGGVVAVVGAKPRMTAEQLMEQLDGRRAPPLLLLLEGVEDARNLGFTLRSAEALGADAVLIKKHLWDFDAVEVARPASGAYERMPLVQIDTVAPLALLQRRGLKLYGCVAGAKRRIHDVDLSGPAIVAIGGEKRGLSGAVRSICDRFIRIPTMGEGTTLSLSHAGAIVLAEAMRQRLAKSSPLSGAPEGTRSGALIETTDPDLPDPLPPEPEDSSGA
jgi:23S rRNA (guanosine2251-2'-O)-methyltransferase